MLDVERRTKLSNVENLTCALVSVFDADAPYTMSSTTLPLNALTFCCLIISLPSDDDY
jgi:hypothetical protein